MCFKCLPSGLTTISSVSLISSTTSPKCRPLASSTKMLTRPGLIAVAAALSNWAAGSGEDSRLVSFFYLFRRLQRALQVDQGQQSPAQPVHRHAMDGLNALPRLFAFQANQFQQVDLRDGR